jgi:hypothetical protein
MIGLPGIVRAKLLVATYGRQFVIILFVVGVLLVGSAGWVYTHPPTTTVTDNTNQQTIESTLRTSAIVTGESNLYQQGAQLRDKPIYLLPATPNATLTVQTTVPPDEDVHLTQQLELVMQATSGGTVFWERSQTLQEQQVTTSDGSLNTSATLDVPELKDRTGQIRSEIGAESSLYVFIRVTTSYETSLYSGSITETSSLRLSQDSYSFKPLTIGKTESTPETREVTLPTRNVFSYLVPAGVGVGVLLLAVAIELIFRRVRGQDTLANQLYRTRYSEWISAGTISPSMGSEHVSVDSLEDLVGIAIDSRKRVLFDESEEVYVVIDGSTVYYYGDWRPRRD